MDRSDLATMTRKTSVSTQETGALRRCAHIPAGSFSVIPRYLLDNGGRVNIGDVLDTCGSMATVLRLALDHIGEDGSLSDEERSGLNCMTNLLRSSFYDIDTMLEQYEKDHAESVELLAKHQDELERRLKSKDVLIAALRKELGEEIGVDHTKDEAEKVAEASHHFADRAHAQCDVAEVLS